MEEDKDLQEAIQACAKIIEEKCRKRPYLLIISKANVGFASEEDRKKRRLRGNTTYMYYARPPLGKDGLSKLLIESSKAAIALAEKNAAGEKKGQSKS